MVQRNRGSPAQPEGRLRWGWLSGAAWLIYLGDPLTATLHHYPGPVRDLGVMAVLAFGVTYLVVRQYRTTRPKDLPYGEEPLA